MSAPIVFETPDRRHPSPFVTAEWVTNTAPWLSVRVVDHTSADKHTFGAGTARRIEVASGPGPGPWLCDSPGDLRALAAGLLDLADRIDVPAAVEPPADDRQLGLFGEGSAA